METGQLLRAARESAQVSLRRMAARSYFTPGYLSQVETGRKPATPQVVAAYEAVLGVILDTQHMDRRGFLAAAAGAAAAAPVIGGVSASIAGGDVGVLESVQTSYAVDLAVAALLDKPSVQRLRGWASDASTAVCRVNATGILAKLPGQRESDYVVRVLQHDPQVRELYLTAVAARAGGLSWDTAGRLVTDTASTLDSPGTPSAGMLAQRFAAEATNATDAGARWCSAAMLQQLSPLLGR